MVLLIRWRGLVAVLEIYIWFVNFSTAQNYGPLSTESPGQNIVPISTESPGEGTCKVGEWSTWIIDCQRKMFKRTRTIIDKPANSACPVLEEFRKLELPAGMGQKILRNICANATEEKENTATGEKIDDITPSNLIESNPELSIQDNTGAMTLIDNDGNKPRILQIEPKPIIKADVPTQKFSVNPFIPVSLNESSEHTEDENEPPAIIVHSQVLQPKRSDNEVEYLETRNVTDDVFSHTHETKPSSTIKTYKHGPTSFHSPSKFVVNSDKDDLQRAVSRIMQVVVHSKEGDSIQEKESPVKEENETKSSSNDNKQHKKYRHLFIQRTSPLKDYYIYPSLKLRTKPLRNVLKADFHKSPALDENGMVVSTTEPPPKSFWEENDLLEFPKDYNPSLLPVEYYGSELNSAGTRSGSYGAPISNVGQSYGGPVSNMGQSYKSPVSNVGQSYGSPLFNAGQSYGGPVSNVGLSYGGPMSNIGMSYGGPVSNIGLSYGGPITKGQSYGAHVSSVGQSYGGPVINAPQSYGNLVSNTGQSVVNPVSNAAQSYEGSISNAGHSYDSSISDAGESYAGPVSKDGQSYGGSISEPGQPNMGSVSNIGQSYENSVSNAGHFPNVHQSKNVFSGTFQESQNTKYDGNPTTDTFGALYGDQNTGSSNAQSSHSSGSSGSSNNILVANGLPDSHLANYQDQNIDANVVHTTNSTIPGASYDSQSGGLGGILQSGTFDNAKVGHAINKKMDESQNDSPIANKQPSAIPVGSETYLGPPIEPNGPNESLMGLPTKSNSPSSEQQNNIPPITDHSQINQPANPWNIDNSGRLAILLEDQLEQERKNRIEYLKSKTDFNDIFSVLENEPQNEKQDDKDSSKDDSFFDFTDPFYSLNMTSWI